MIGSSVRLAGSKLLFVSGMAVLTGVAASWGSPQTIDDDDDRGEIVITATRREQRLIDVPADVTVSRVPSRWRWC